MLLREVLQKIDSSKDRERALTDGTDVWTARQLLDRLSDTDLNQLVYWDKDGINPMLHNGFIETDKLYAFINDGQGAPMTIQEVQEKNR